MNRPLVIGLTGGIASGKSAVADHFAALGVPVIDSDVIARQVVEPGELALAAVVDAFGPGVLALDGRLDRPALRTLVFADPDARRRLEGLLHPAIRARMAAEAMVAGGAYQVHVIPLLVEGGRADAVDRVLVVDCPEALQLKRLAARDGETPERARTILAAQASRAERLAAADDVILNDGSLEDLRSKVADLDRRYRDIASRRG